MWYLGPVGALQKFRGPAPGMQTTLNLGAGQHELVSGGIRVDYPPLKPRSFQLNWNALSVAERNTLRAILLTDYGQPPYALVDPSEKQLLEGNVASAGMRRASADGFSASASTVARLSSGGSQLAGAVGWTIPNASGTKTLTIGTRELPVPVIGSSWPLTFTLYAKAAASTACTLSIAWKDADGDALTASTESITVGTTVARQTVSGTAPASAVSAALTISTTVQPSGGRLVTLDGFQAEYASSASAYYAGSLPGVAWVAPLTWQGQLPVLDRTQAQMTLVEVF